MSDKSKLIIFGVVGGFAVGGLIGSATFGLWGGVVGSIVGVLAGGGTMAVVASAATPSELDESPSEDDSAEANAK